MITLVRILRSLWDLTIILYGLAMMFVSIIAVPATLMALGYLVVPWLWHHINELGLWYPRAWLVAALATAWWCGVGLTILLTHAIPGAARKQGHSAPVNHRTEADRHESAVRGYRGENAETPPGPPDHPSTPPERVG